MLLLFPWLGIESTWNSNRAFACCRVSCQVSRRVTRSLFYFRSRPKNQPKTIGNRALSSDLFPLPATLKTTQNAGGEVNEKKCCSEQVVLFFGDRFGSARHEGGIASDTLFDLISLFTISKRLKLIKKSRERELPHGRKLFMKVSPSTLRPFLPVIISFSFASFFHPFSSLLPHLPLPSLHILPVSLVSILPPKPPWQPPLPGLVAPISQTSDLSIRHCPVGMGRKEMGRDRVKERKEKKEGGNLHPGGRDLSISDFLNHFQNQMALPVKQLS